ncbi:nuclear transport factor 2 family protein [Zobellia laminariae]|uniref:nuclear transport factor 2 family protein n=1 Tax=Zobellia laminariae TaxID=248906 RepID=UPI0026F45E4D|nr:nuclear transport factor 2 family protein [Zobellia laminariae]WKX74771.1 nuclear transport factor 2 family protein [Zobellia laminariae]
MKQAIHSKILHLVFFLLTCVSFAQQQKDSQESIVLQNQNEVLFTAVLTKHLNAVTTKNLEALKATLSPNGAMELIQPSSEIVYSVDGFIKFHEDWFKMPNWTVSTKILSTDVGDTIGVATTEFMYKEPERNGKPYFNRLIVSYTLEKTNGNWYVIKDHASSIEKTEN